MTTAKAAPMTVEQIDKATKALRIEKGRLEAVEFHANTLPRLRRMVGKAYLYRNNCYSCARDNERWNAYRKLLQIVPDESANCSMIFEEFQVDYMGKATIGLETRFVGAYTALPEAGWEPCSLREYSKHRNRALSQIRNPKILKDYLSKP